MTIDPGSLDIVDRIRRGRAHLPEDVDSRLAARVHTLAARPDGAERREDRRAGRRGSSRAQMAAAGPARSELAASGLAASGLAASGLAASGLAAAGLAAAGLAVVLGIGWRVGATSGRPGGTAATASTEAAGGAGIPDGGLAGPQDPPPPVAPTGVQEPAPAATQPRGGARIALWSPIVAVVERLDENGASVLRVLRWIKRPERATAERYRLVPGKAPEREGLFLSFLDRQPCAPGRPMIVELDWADGSGEVPGTVRPVRSVELHGLPTVEQGYGQQYATPHKALLAEVLRATESTHPEVRRSAVAALFSWMGQITTTELVPPATLWEGVTDAEPGLGSVPARLLQLATDPDPVLREIGAQGIPTSAGPAGRRTLYRLAFDPEPSVRRRALRSLQAFESDTAESWLDPAEGVQDTWWEEFTGTLSWPSWRQRAIHAASEEGITDPVGIWERQLHKPRTENHLVGVVGLGELGLGELGPGGLGPGGSGPAGSGPAVSGPAESGAAVRERALQLLCDQRAVRDPRVRAAAAVSRLRLGDRSAWRDIEAMALSDDSRAAVFAIDRVRRIERLETLDLLDLVCESATAPVVRAHAAAALRALRPIAEFRVLALIDGLQKDPHPMVRAAAGLWPPK